MMKKFLSLSAAVLLAFGLLSVPAIETGAEAPSAEASPYVLDFSDENTAERLMPVYVAENAAKGEEESLSEHWLSDTKAGTLTRINDVGGQDVTGNYAALYFKDCYLRYFELTTEIKIGAAGLEGIIFGNKDMSLRHMASGNGIYFMPDPCVEVKGLTISKPATSSKFASKDDFYKFTVAVCEEYFRVYVDDVLRIDTQYPAELIEYGRVGLFTANTEGAFRGKVEIYPLTADGEKQSFEKAALVEGIEAEEETIEMEYGDDPVKLGYRILPENSAEKAVRFLSENPDVATVDTDGYLHALKEGTTVIQMITKDGGFIAETVVQVTKTIPEIAGVTLNVNDAALSVGEKLYLEAGYYPAEAENLGFKWSSSDTSVAIVNNGTVTAMGEGECVISVRDYYGNFKAECKVVVGTKKSESEGGCKSNLSGISAAAVAMLAAAGFSLKARRNKNG